MSAWQRRRLAHSGHRWPFGVDWSGEKKAFRPWKIRQENQGPTFLRIVGCSGRWMSQSFVAKLAPSEVSELIAELKRRVR